MPSPEQILAVFGEWVAKADDDLKAASHMLKLGTDCPAGIVCFHAQQCVEKYLKAGLVCEGTPFRKTHSIAELLDLLPAHFKLLLPVDEQHRMTNYATTARYPGDDDPIPLREARHAVALARLVRKEIRSAYWTKRGGGGTVKGRGRRPS